MLLSDLSLQECGGGPGISWQRSSHSRRRRIGISASGTATYRTKAALPGFRQRPLYFFKTLNLLALHGGRDVVRLPDGERNDGQRRVAGRAAGALAAVGHQHG